MKKSQLNKPTPSHGEELPMRIWENANRATPVVVGRI
jgi:hypothetical protein